MIISANSFFKKGDSFNLLSVQKSSNLLVKSIFLLKNKIFEIIDFPNFAKLWEIKLDRNRFEYFDLSLLTFFLWKEVRYEKLTSDKKEWPKSLLSFHKSKTWGINKLFK